MARPHGGVLSTRCKNPRRKVTSRSTIQRSVISRACVTAHYFGALRCKRIEPRFFAAHKTRPRQFVASELTRALLLEGKYSLAMTATQASVGGATVGWVKSGKGWRPALKVRLALPCLSCVTYSRLFVH